MIDGQSQLKSGGGARLIHADLPGDGHVLERRQAIAELQRTRFRQSQATHEMRLIHERQLLRAPIHLPSRGRFRETEAAQ